MPELNYGEIKSELEKTCTSLNIPRKSFEFRFEREEFALKLALKQLDDASFIEVISLCKKHIENWRIHTFERGYLSLQALNENIFDAKDLLNNIKVRVSGIYGEKLLEVQKKSNLTQSELSLCISLVEFFFSKKAPQDPLDLLRQAGCSVYLPDKETKSFADFAGYKDIIEQVKETIIMPLTRPEVFDKITEKTRTSFESNRPKAVLFAGPPGVGKTTMSRIIARESNVPLVYVPLESIMSSYYGESSKKLALIFDIAESTAKGGMLLFLDEIDSLAPSRNEKIFEATRRMLSVLLRKIDGLESQGKILTIGATNRQEDLDAALISRFDTIMQFPYPGKEDIVAILGLYAKHLPGDQRTQLAEKLVSLAPRTIIDICKRAERMQAREIIQSGKEEISLPGIEKYLQAIHTKS